MDLFRKSLYFNNLMRPVIFFFESDKKMTLSFVLTSDSKNRLNNTASCFSLRTHKKSVARDIGSRAIATFRIEFPSHPSGLTARG